MALIEIVVSMLILAVSALAVTATVSMVNGKEMRRAGGSSLDLQALNYARETLESLKSAVSTDATRSAPLSIGTHNSTNDSDTTRTTLPTSDLLSAGGTRSYEVSNGPSGTDLKKVKVTVSWTD